MNIVIKLIATVLVNIMEINSLRSCVTNLFVGSCRLFFLVVVLMDPDIGLNFLAWCLVIFLGLRIYAVVYYLQISHRNP
jgi:hypothetical protein